MAQSSNLGVFANNVNAQGTPVLPNTFETTTVSATAATGTINYDVSTQSVLYYTTNSSANWTMNIRWSSTATLNSILSTGQTVTVVFMADRKSTRLNSSH